MFRAYDPDQDRLVAVKLFRLDLPPDRVQTLVAHLQTLIDADLTHPAIAAPIATGITDRTAYLALDFIADDSADVVAREQGPTPVAQAVRVASQLAGALDFAVDANIAHGALHPRDVLIASDDARVTGIGITQVLERVGVAAPVRRPYTAPERAAGAAWDRRADIFSLAAIVHELLWGRRIAATGQQAAAQLTPLDGIDLEALRRLFGRALAEDPADRFDSAREFSEGLRQALTAAAPFAERATPAHAPVDRPTKDARRAIEEPRLPLDGDTGGDEQRNEPDVTKTFAPTEETLIVNSAADSSPSSSIVEEIDATIAEGDTLPAATPGPSDDRGNREGRDEDSHTAIVQTPPVMASSHLFAASEPGVGRTRSAVWPLTMALGIGLAVGFALGYSVAGREEESVATQSAAPPAMPPGVVPSRGVAETEVRLKTVADENPSSSPPSRGAEDPAPPKAAQAPATGRLLVRSTPAGATAFVDGRVIGRTPVIERDVEPGSYLVRVTHEGFVAQERRISVSASQPSQSVSFDLARARRPSPAPSTPATIGRPSGAVSVESRPAGASVILDGKVVGTTPMTLGEVADGTHTVSLELAGYRRWSISVKVVGGERHRVAASLER